MAKSGMSEVYKYARREAKRGNVQAMKLLAERYDLAYKPSSAVDINADSGRRPPDPEESRKWIAEQEEAEKKAGENIENDSTENIDVLGRRPGNLN
jgi:hypothetical protein